MTRLPNSELDWQSDTVANPAELETLERDLGLVRDGYRVLAGGHANLNALVGTDRVVRVYRRDPDAAGREAVLLSLPWSSFRVPRILERGARYVVLENVEHGPLEGSVEHGAAAGRALAEIHGRRFEVSGFLGPDLVVERPMPDFVAALQAHVADDLGSAPAGIRAAVAGAFERQRSALGELAGAPVLLHGDYKVSNLHWTPRGELLVLDWEFAYAGPALMDVGQLVRWGAPAEFKEAFADAYRANGGELPGDWERWAAVFDLANLLGLLAGAAPGSRRAVDLERRIGETVELAG